MGDQRDDLKFLQDQYSIIRHFCEKYPEYSQEQIAFTWISVCARRYRRGDITIEEMEICIDNCLNRVNGG